MVESQEQKGGAARVVLLALGFCCLLLSQCLPFVADGSLGLALSGPEAQAHVFQSLACVVTLAILAVAAWVKVARLGSAAVVASGVILAVSLLGSALVSHGVVHAGANMLAGVSSGVVMYAWAHALASLPKRLMVQSTLVGFCAAVVVSLVCLCLVKTAVLGVAAAAALGCVVVLLAYDRSASFVVFDGSLSREQLSSFPWFAVVVVVACCLLGAFLLGVGVQITWVYGQSLNYVALGISVVLVVLLTALIMIGEGEWPAAVWVPLFVVFLIGDVFACLSTSLAVEVSLGLLLGCVISLQFLRFSVFSALVEHAHVPRGFLLGILLLLSGGYLAGWGGALAGRTIAMGMKGLSQMAGLVAVFVLVLFAVMVALFMRRPRQAAVMASSPVEVASESEAEGTSAAARIAALAAQFGLTEREVEVAELSSQGFNAPYIAEKLVVSQSTVRFHLQNVYRKLNIHSRAELIELVNEPAE